MHELRDPLPLPATVLVVGSEDDAHDIEAALEYPGSKVVRGSSGAHARRILRSERVRLLVTDLFLRDGDARDLLAWMRARPATATIPAIVVARAATPEIRDACVLLGAERVVEKPVLAEELSTAATEAVEKSERCANAARKDPVTDLPNRAAFLERFERAAAFAARPGRALSAARLCVDHLGWVRESHGRQAGDEVLRRTAATLRRSLRRSDYLARWGGEELVVLFPDSPPRGVAVALENALAVLRSVRMRLGDNVGFGIAFSAGVTEVQPGVEIDEILDEADHHLYRARIAGGGRVVWAGVEPDPPYGTILVAAREAAAGTVGAELRREGLEVVRCTSVRAARTAMDAHEVDLAIVDVDLPEEGGLALLEALRRAPEHAGQRYLLLCAPGREADVVRALELGAVDFALEPASPLELRARVRRILIRG